MVSPTITGGREDRFSNKKITEITKETGAEATIVLTALVVLVYYQLLFGDKNPSSKSARHIVLLKRVATEDPLKPTSLCDLCDLLV
jgi:hypothetical protein